MGYRTGELALHGGVQNLIRGGEAHDTLGDVDPIAQCVQTLRSDCGTSCWLGPEPKGSAFGLIVSRPPMGSLSLRPGDSLTAPRAALSVGFIRFVSSANATQATGVVRQYSIRS